VRLGVRAQPDSGRQRRCHDVEIALEGVEIDEQRRRVDLVHRHAGQGWRAEGHGHRGWLSHG
jgi:hypothetical protein